MCGECWCFNSKIVCSAICALVLGVPTVVIHSVYWYQAYLVNAELEGSVETTCEIVQIGSSTCVYDDDDDGPTTYGLKFWARAYVDICSPKFNKTIPWKHVGLGDCYHPKYYEKSGLPVDEYYEGIHWTCRANCEKERWYTSDFHGYDEYTNFVFIIGFSLLSFSFLSCFFYIWWMSEKPIKCIKWSRKEEPKSARITVARPDFARFDRLVDSIQGDWSNSDGLLISVKNRQATFLPSGNSYKIDFWGTDEVSIRINDQIWSMVTDKASYDTSKKSIPHSRCAIYWRNNGETIKWSPRKNSEDVPPSFENAAGLPTYDQVELCVSTPPVHQNASAPPAYEMMSVNTAGAKKKLFPNSHEV